MLVCWGAPAAAQTGPSQPFVFDWGGVQLKPGGFFELIGLTRSATTPDTINTHFGAIPLIDTPAESVLSPNHSRLLLRADAPAGPVALTMYLESDFLNPNAGQSPYRWRQYWGAARWGKWELMGGRAWSLLRPNRTGVESDTGLMNTLVVEPAYHVGLVGTRNRQFRLSRAMGDYHAVLAWETAGQFLAKATVDKRFGHVEAAAIAGRGSQRGVSAAATLKVSGRVRFVTQEYWSKAAAYEALGVVPARVNGGSALEGIEVAASRHVDVYSYAGWVYATRSVGNRVVREYTAGGDYRIPAPSIHGAAISPLQVSRMDRGLWTGQSGVMTYAMYRFRYSFN
jgi:hypothetical protein